MSWIQVLLDFLRQFWPFEIVWSYQKGIRFWRGIDTKELDPGLYMFLPFFGHIEAVIVKPDILKLWKLNITTKDGVGITVSANIKYEVVNARTAFCEVQDYKDNMADECRTHLAKRIRAADYEDLRQDLAKLEKSCEGTMTTAVKDYGVVIIRVGITDFVKTRNISLVNL